MIDADAPLHGRRVVTTRDELGELDRLLAEAGADVVHVPLIEIAEPLDGGAELQALLHALDGVDWVVVTSRHGAALVGDALAGRPAIRIAAVGRAPRTRSSDWLDARSTSSRPGRRLPTCSKRCRRAAKVRLSSWRKPTAPTWG